MRKNSLPPPHINNNDAYNLSEYILAGMTEIPEMGLTRKSLARSKNPSNTLQGRVEKALAGDPKIHRACAETVYEMQGRVSRVVLSALAEGCCDPMAWILLSEHVDSVIVPGKTSVQNVISVQNPDLAESSWTKEAILFLESNVHWNCGSVNVGIQIPETLAVCAKGRSLSSLITHPVLDRIDFEIISIQETDSGSSIYTNYVLMTDDQRSVAYSDLNDENMFLNTSTRSSQWATV